VNVVIFNVEASVVALPDAVALVVVVDRAA
jgi:hypothetical protein